jgi:superfamily II RNA helicase
MPATLATTYTFPLDPFQQHAIAAISRDENVLVTAKTGSGKTLVGEYQIHHSLAKGRRVFYTTPIKSLSNQKFYDLKQMFPDRVGIMTGDVKFKPDADVVIMTTEILRNLLFKRGTVTESLGITAALSLDRLDAVVFDECHYINDRDRGAVWEETMILLPPSTNLVLLSATIDGPEKFAGWLGALKQKPIHLISTQYRIVPLMHGVYRGEEFLPIMDNKEHFDAGTYTAWLKWRQAQEKEGDVHKQRVADRRRGGYEDGPVARKGSVKSFTHQLNAMIGRLEGKELLPALFFVFSRKDCERYAAAVEHTLIDSSDAAAVNNIIKFHLHKYELDTVPQYHTIKGLLEKGIAFHHSGLLPVLKEIVEILFGRGYVKVLFATETFAVGINMPTKTVVFTGYRKYDDATEGMRLLNTDEYIQMAGRAGRRGKDDKGIVLYLPDREPEYMEDVKRMMVGKRATFNSRMNFHYDFLLKTLQLGELRWLDIMRQSYWFRRHELIKEQCQAELDALKAGAPTLTDTELADMAELERLQELVRSTVNAARREAQRSLESWKQKHMGPRWYAIEKELWPKHKAAAKERLGLERELEAMETPQQDILPSFKVLGELGFLEERGLTQLGHMATEVNEGHPILMPLAWDYVSKAGLDAKELLAFLAVFLGEGENSSPHVPAKVLNCIRELELEAKRCIAVEVKIGAVQPPKATYWDINTAYVNLVWRYVNGETVTQLAADYGIFEGNCIRLLSKMKNLLDEWKVLATIATNTDMLNMLQEAATDELLAIGVGNSDSLYLRL